MLGRRLHHVGAPLPQGRQQAGHARGSPTVAPDIHIHIGIGIDIHVGINIDIHIGVRERRGGGEGRAGQAARNESNTHSTAQHSTDR